MNVNNFHREADRERKRNLGKYLEVSFVKSMTKKKIELKKSKEQ